MGSILFTNGTAILPNQLLRNADVFCQNGLITQVGRFKGKRANQTFVVDAQGGYISPGFIDIHVHGGDSADFMDGTVDAFQTACRAHARHGTTTIFPTTTTGSSERINAMLEAARICSTIPDSGSRIEGVHLYGPYFAPDKVGCHPADGQRAPVAHEFDMFFDSKMVRVATCAAELPGAVDFFKTAQLHKCLVTCGHSNASWQEMQLAFDSGMRHVDHFWCAMSSVPSVRARLGVPMQGSMAEYVLMNAEMSTEVIADGFHLAQELLEFAFRMKGPKRLLLVTDCNRALDQPAGKYRFGSLFDGSWFESDGNVGWAPNGSLASSVQGMDHMVRHMFNHTTATLPEVVRMASLTPAERTGISSQTGSLEVRKRADILVLDRELNVKRVFIGGREHY